MLRGATLRRAAPLARAAAPLSSSSGGGGGGGGGSGSGAAASAGRAEQAPAIATDEVDLRDKVLRAALGHVNRRGWSKEALAAGAVDVGLLPVSHGIFSRGPAELAEFWMAVGNHDLDQFLAEQREQGVRGQALVAAALCHRLLHNVPYLRSWPQAMAMGLSPQNVSTTLQRLHSIPESICRAADESEGGKEWAERKAAVGAIFASAELYMLTDYSEGYEDTRAFVEARLRDSLLLEDKLPLHTLSAVAGGIGSLFSAAATMVSPMVPGTAAGSSFPTPPNPSEVVSKLGEHAQKAQRAAQNIASSPNPVRAAASVVHQAATGQHEQAPQQAPPQQAPPQQAPPQQAPPQHMQQPVQAARHESARVPMSDDPLLDEQMEGTGALETVQLPAGLSLFGLMSMDASEAKAIVEKSNPTFQVLLTKAEDSDTEPLFDPRVVRLLVDENNIVVDVLRS